jgi:hypothetical protein
MEHAGDFVFRSWAPVVAAEHERAAKVRVRREGGLQRMREGDLSPVA